MIVLHRMERMIGVMYAVIEANKKFNMDAWMDIADDLETDNNLTRGEPCNTVCCAAGYGALDTILQGEGLHMVGLANGEPMGPIFTTKDYNKLLKDGLSRVEIAFGEDTDFDALSKFFGISDNAADYLFDPSTYDRPDQIEPLQVIERMRDVIKLDGLCPDDLDDDGEPSVEHKDTEIGFGPYTGG